MSIGAWASDFVLIGTYTNDRDRKDYDVILEYEGENFINLEINTRGSEDSQFCAWEVRGERKIRSLYSCLQELLGIYKDIDDASRNNNVKSMQEELDIDWPTFNIRGRHFGKSSDYEVENLEDKSTTQAYYIVKNGIRQLMVLSVLIDDYDEIPLKTALNFTSPERMTAFVHLIDPEFLTERIHLKEKLLNEKR